MEYTGIQLSAMTALAVLASGSDGNIDKKELEVISHHLHAFVQDEEKLKNLLAAALLIKFEDAAKIVKDMNYEQKRHFAAFIGVIILADGTISDDELEYWKALSAATNLPHMTIRDAANIFVNNMVGNQNSTSYVNSNGSGGKNFGCLIWIVVIAIVIIFVANK